VVDPVKKTCATFLGTGKPGCVDGDIERAQFNEPGGMDTSPDGSTLYVADTNSHAIRVVDLKTKTVSSVSDAGRKARACIWKPSCGDRFCSSMASCSKLG
jgi:sugar lactone lactonase YvrE